MQDELRGTEVTEDERERGLTAFREGRYADAAAIYAKIAERTRRKLSLATAEESSEKRAAEGNEKKGNNSEEWVRPGASPFGYHLQSPPHAQDALRTPPGFERACTSSSSSSSSSDIMNRKNRRESGSSSNSTRFSAMNYEFFDQDQQSCFHLEWEMEKGEGSEDGEEERGRERERESPCADLLQILGQGVGAGFTGLTISQQVLPSASTSDTGPSSSSFSSSSSSQGLRMSTVGERARCANPSAWHHNMDLPFVVNEKDRDRNRDRDRDRDGNYEQEIGMTHQRTSRFQFARPIERAEPDHRTKSLSFGAEAQLPSYQSFGWGQPEDKCSEEGLGWGGAKERFL